MPIERTEWLKRMRRNAEALYNRLSPRYGVTFGLETGESHRHFLKEFLGRVSPGGTILSAACGAGRFDGRLLDAGFTVVGIDQSAGMLARAMERYPQAQYRKVALQELDFQGYFDGVLCMDAMEHVPPEEYPGILRAFARALKPGGPLYFTADREEEPDFDLEACYRQAHAAGWPVVFGEVADETAFELAMSQPEVTGEQADAAVYHYYPPLERVRAWIDAAGFLVEAEGAGGGFHHFVARRG